MTSDDISLFIRHIEIHLESFKIIWSHLGHEVTKSSLVILFLRGLITYIGHSVSFSITILAKIWSNWKLNNWTDTSRNRMVPRDHNDGFMALYMMLFFLSVLPFSDLSRVSERMGCDQKTKMVYTCVFVPYIKGRYKR